MRGMFGSGMDADGRLQLRGQPRRWGHPRTAFPFHLPREAPMTPQTSIVEPAVQAANAFLHWREISELQSRQGCAR